MIHVPINDAATVTDGSKSLNHVPIRDAATVIDGPSLTRVPVTATVTDGQTLSVVSRSVSRSKMIEKRSRRRARRQPSTNNEGSELFCAKSYGWSSRQHNRRAPTTGQRTKGKATWHQPSGYTLRGSKGKCIPRGRRQTILRRRSCEGGRQKDARLIRGQDGQWSKSKLHWSVGRTYRQ